MMSDNKITNILVVGTGGQGVMTAAEILAQAAIEQGLDVKKTEVAGMAQRGGVVSSHVRFGNKVLSPEIMPGEADILVGFEAAEAMRWCHFLRPGGVAMMNTLRLTPPIVSIGMYPYPDDPATSIRTAGVRVYDFDAGAIARELGGLNLVNTVMLGAIADLLPFPAGVLEESVLQRFRGRKEEWVPINKQAFEAGRAAGKKAGLN